MTIALALLAGALAAGWWLPRPLRRAERRRHDPTALIVGWLAAMTSVLLTAALGVALLLLPGHGGAGAILSAVHHCWSAIQHGSTPRLEELVGVVGAALLLALAGRVAILACRSIRRCARRREEHLAVLRMSGRHRSGWPDALWLPHERPLAFSLTGRRGVIVATDGLTRCLPPSGVAAVLVHERAHLAGRHHLLVTAAQTLHSALPFVPLFRQAPAAIRGLVEFAADAVAVRQCGRTAVREALVAVSGHGAPEFSLTMARDAVDARLARLHSDHYPPTPPRRVLSCAIAGLSTALLPLLASGGLLTGLALIACPVST